MKDEIKDAVDKFSINLSLAIKTGRDHGATVDSSPLIADAQILVAAAVGAKTGIDEYGVEAAEYFGWSTRARLKP